MAQILLHGTLHATIFEASSLSNPHRASGAAPKFIRKLVEGVEDTVGVGKGTTKVYATIDLEKARVGRTRMMTNEPVNPRWYESFHIYCAHLAADVIFTVKVDNPIGASLIGRAYLPVQELLGGQEIDRWLEVCNDKREPVGESKIHVKLQYFDISKDHNWARGVRSTKYPGVPYTFFSQRQGCKVTLYQDAHVPDNFIPKIPLADGKNYEPHRCWEDIFDAISNAQHLIYITGWSVYTEIKLVRDTNRPKPGGDVTLGELLKRKASEGVRILMLVWDDRTSVGLLKRDGLMATHDEETANYFHGTDVHCVLCPRNPDDSGSIVQDLQISTMFTHHQKIVVVDHEMPNKGSQQRRIVSFVGGIDLCDGRYDTQYHSLFRTLDTVHHDDFHQPNFATASIKKGGPREPWHDIHSQLEGPIAWDVLYNFEQRWRKQGGKDLLVQLRDLSEIIIPPSPVMFPEDRDTWNVQLFRSIDGGAAFGFPDTPEEAARAGLVSGKDQIIDRSIQDAYINAIRRAKNFIYIENQYFLGSSYCWKPEGIKPEEIGALHLIPKELVLKVVSKIEAGERFTVYVVVPMWPEGVPESASVQAILDWQRRTMEMMYTDIIQALQAKGIEANPKDYLTFFCLGNREVKQSREYEPEEHPEPDTDYIRAQEARRFMIYVHTKMMIVDDEYIIIGSANINQRSMDGARDSEIAMGAYQPYHLATRQPARGQVHGFRMALWYEPSFSQFSSQSANSRGADGDGHRHVSPRWRLDHTSVRVGGRHTLASCSPPFSPSHSTPPSRLHPPSVPTRRRPTPADQDPRKLRNQNLGMVADTESSDSLAGSSNAAAAEKPVDGSLDKSSQEKAPRKTHKAEREKLKRDQLNDLFLELTSMLDLDRQNSGKATVLGDAARVLRDLVTQVESLRKEQSALLTERQYVSSEKNELQEENTTLKAQILELQNELRARMGNNSLNLSSLGMSHPIGSNSPNLATHPMPRHIWSNGSNLSTLPMTQPTNTLSPLQNQHRHSDDSGQVYAPRPLELQLFPGTSASLERERSQHRSTLATSSSLTDSLPGQLRLSLPQTSQEESSSGALGSRKERKNG